MKPEELDDMYDLPDSLVDRMYNDLVADKLTDSQEDTDRSHVAT